MSRRVRHVLHVVDALALGGAERMVIEIANQTARDGIRTSVCVTRSDTTMAERLDPRIELIVLGRRRRFQVRPLARLARWCAAERVEVVHCHGRSSLSLVALLSTLRALDAAVVFHDHRGIELDARVPRWFPIASRRIAQYVAVYERQLDWAVRGGMPADRVVMIPNAVDMNAVVAQRLVGAPLPANDATKIIFVGGLRAEKGVDVLLEAIARVERPVTLFVVGGDADAAYAERCRERGRRSDLEGRVVFLGQRADALALAATADLAVHSSRSESGPLVLIEYAALGLPFVATRVGGIATSLATDRAGEFVPPENVEALAAAITKLVDLPRDQRRALGERERELAYSRFDVSVVIEQWYRTYARALEVTA